MDNGQGIWIQPFIFTLSLANRSSALTILQVNLAEPQLIPTNFASVYSVSYCLHNVIKKYKKCAPNKVSLLPRPLPAVHTPTPTKVNEEGEICQCYYLSDSSFVCRGFKQIVITWDRSRPHIPPGLHAVECSTTSSTVGLMIFSPTKFMAYILLYTRIVLLTVALYRSRQYQLATVKIIMAPLNKIFHNRHNA